jgi:hypothetical protein
MTTGSEAIWNSEPRMFEDMNMPIAEGVQQNRSWGVDNDELTETEQPQPDDAEKVSDSKKGMRAGRHSRATILILLLVFRKGLILDVALALDGQP